MIADTIPSGALDDYKIKNYIPKNIDLGIINFKEFIEEREKLIINRLEKELLKAIKKLAFN